MSTCEEIVAKAIEDYKINRTITATTWLNILVSLTFIVTFILYYSSSFTEDKKSFFGSTLPLPPFDFTLNFALSIILFLFVINLILSSFFLSKSDDERKNHNELNIGTQSYALVLLLLITIFYPFYVSTFKKKKTLNVFATIIFIIVYFALLITSLVQSKKL